MRVAYYKEKKMAISTQIRLNQLTGSFGAGGIVDTDAAGEPNPSDSEAMVGNLSAIVSAIKRINGGTNWWAQDAGEFAQDIKVAGNVTGNASGDMTISAGSVGSNRNLIIKGNEDLRLETKATVAANANGGKLTATFLPFGTQAEIETMAAGNAGVTLIGAINAASSGAPTGVGGYVSSVRTVSNQNATARADRMNYKYDFSSAPADANIISFNVLGGGTAAATKVKPGEIEIGLEYKNTESGGFLKHDGTVAAARTKTISLLGGASGFKARAVAMTFSGNPTDGQTFTVKRGDTGANVTFTAKSSGAAGAQFNIVAGNNNQMATNVAAMLNAQPFFQAVADNADVYIYQQFQMTKDNAVSQYDVSGITGLGIKAGGTPDWDKLQVIAGASALVTATADSGDDAMVILTAADNGHVSRPSMLFTVGGNSNTGVANFPQCQMVGGGSASEFQGASAQGDQEIDLNITGFDKASIVDRVDVYLNGQLLVSGSVVGPGAQAYGPNTDVDYVILSPADNTKVVFGFDLVEGDRVQVKVR